MLHHHFVGPSATVDLSAATLIIFASYWRFLRLAIHSAAVLLILLNNLLLFLLFIFTLMLVGVLESRVRELVVTHEVRQALSCREVLTYHVPHQLALWRLPVVVIV